MKNKQTTLAIVLLAAAGSIFLLWSPQPDGEATASALVQADDPAAAAVAVRAVGGEITHRLAIIDAVAARLTNAQRAALTRNGEVRVYDDRHLESAGRFSEPTTSAITASFHQSLVAADVLHGEGITGQGVTLAVVDSGLYVHRDLNRNTRNKSRLLAHYDAIGDQELYPLFVETDDSGHGGHVASISVNSEKKGSGYEGIAPDADLVVVKAFDADGRGTYADVIRGLDWVVANASSYGIRVANLSFSGTPLSYYWDDPLNQAVMRAWQAGIVVVASAGNLGPDAGTIGVPGNVPYVITVGAMTDNYTPGDGGDDFLASFSSVGPTFEAFLKPEVVAPGGHVRALMNDAARIAVEHPEFHDGGTYFTMSGTSQAAAVVSGIAALMLAAEPALSPDDVKCRLTAGARPAVDAEGELAYSVFQQGAGLVNAFAAVYSTELGCANSGLDVGKDLDGLEHYAGPARQADDGSFYIEGFEGYEWDGSYANGGAYLWDNDFIWQDAYLWDNRFIWDSAYLWDNGTLGGDAYLWDNLNGGAYLWDNVLSEPMDINIWVEQQ